MNEKIKNFLDNRRKRYYLVPVFSAGLVYWRIRKLLPEEADSWEAEGPFRSFASADDELLRRYREVTLPIGK